MSKVRWSCTPELRSGNDLQELIMIPNPCLANLHSACTVLALMSVVEAGDTGLFAILRVRRANCSKSAKISCLDQCH